MKGMEMYHIRLHFFDKPHQPKGRRPIGPAMDSKKSAFCCGKIDLQL